MTQPLPVAWTSGPCHLWPRSLHPRSKNLEQGLVESDAQHPPCAAEPCPACLVFVSQICARPRRPAPPIKDRRRGPSATSNRTLLRACTARTRGWRARTPSTSLLQQPGAASPLAAASAGCAAPSASLLRSCFLMCNGLQSTQRSAEPGFAHVFSSFRKHNETCADTSSAQEHPLVS